MKGGIFVVMTLLMSLISFRSAAVDADVLVRNQRFGHDTLFFDIYLEASTSTSLFLSNSDFVLNFTESNFSNPVLNYLSGSTELYNAYGTSTNFYDTNIGSRIESAGLNAYKLMVYVQMPVYSNQTDFLNRIARIDQQPLTHKLGTFYITGATSLNTNPGLSWVTTGKGLVLLVNHRDSVTMAKAHATINAVNPALETEPGQQANSLAITATGSTTLSLSWSGGSGSGRILFIKEAGAINVLPTDGLTYTPNTEYAVGDQLGTSGAYSVFKGTGTSVTVTGLTANTTYHFALFEFEGDNGWSENYLQNNPDTLSGTTNGPYIVANIKVYLHGAYSTQTSNMRTDLNSAGLIPLNQPYSGNNTGWKYNGQENLTSIPNANIIDWVIVELRTGVNASDTLSSGSKRAGFLLKDGSLVDTNGVDPIRFYGVSGGDYYLIVRHRNHLPIMSANKVTLNSSSSLYDFTTGQSQAYGTNPLIQLASGVFGMAGGDANVSRIVTAADRNVISSNFSATNYSLGDTNLSGIISAADRNIISTSFNKSSQVLD